MLKRWVLYVGSVALGLAIVGALLGAFILALLYPTLPSLETLTDYQPKVPLRVLSAEGELIGLLGAADKPGGFTDGDVQILSTFAGPVATFLRSRQSFERQRR